MRHTLRPEEIAEVHVLSNERMLLRCGDELFELVLAGHGQGSTTEFFRSLPGTDAALRRTAIALPKYTQTIENPGFFHGFSWILRLFGLFDTGFLWLKLALSPRGRLFLAPPSYVSPPLPSLGRFPAPLHVLAGGHVLHLAASAELWRAAPLAAVGGRAVCRWHRAAERLVTVTSRGARRLRCEVQLELMDVKLQERTVRQLEACGPARP